MSSLIAVKISRGKENRRISFDYQNIDLNQVKKVTSELFGIPYEFSFVYLDHEGDEISLGSEMEWKEALRISPYDNIIDSSAINLRIVSQNYKKKGLQKREKKNKNKKEKEPVMIHNAFCDMCNDRIEGARFNCLECPDFDLCDDCMTDSRKDHPAHQFACITNPFHLQQLKKYKSDKLFQEEEAEAEASEPCMLESVVPELLTLVESQIWDVSRPLDDSLVDLPELHVEEEENEDDYDDDDFVDWESSSESGDEEAEEEQLFDAQADQVPALVEDPFESRDANEESEDEEEEPLASESEDEEEEECPSLAASDIPAVEIAVVEVPVVTPSPLAASVSQTQYAEQHRQLVDMGFHDLQRNEACLIENEGDLVQAVLSLLG